MPKRIKYQFTVEMEATRREANKLHAALADAVEKARDEEAVGASLTFTDVVKCDAQAEEDEVDG